MKNLRINNDSIPSVHKLKSIMSQLRGPNGCPWDKEQNHNTLIPYLIEEAYEVIEAIEINDKEKLCEELGDLFLQVVFHCQIAEERGEFSLEDIARGIVEKLIRRHPHVFSDLTVTDSQQVVRNWEEIKKKEKKKSDKSIFNTIPKNLSALLKADLITKKASKAGFDWPDFNGILEKLHEEIEEFKIALRNDKSSEIKEEMGDLLFTLVNLSRHVNVDPEYALNKTSEKFIRRFNRIEKLLYKQGKNLEDMTLKELDKLWDSIKEEEKNET